MRALKLLNTLFSPTVLPDEKKRILSKKYNIVMTVELESEVQRMCNLGTAIVQKKSACSRQKNILILRVESRFLVSRAVKGKVFIDIQCLSPAKKYKLYKSSINKSIHFVQRSLSSSTRG